MQNSLKAHKPHTNKNVNLYKDLRVRARRELERRNASALSSPRVFTFQNPAPHPCPLIPEPAAAHLPPPQSLPFLDMGWTSSSLHIRWDLLHSILLIFRIITINLWWIGSHNVGSDFFSNGMDVFNLIPGFWQHVHTFMTEDDFQYRSFFFNDLQFYFLLCLCLDLGFFFFFLFVSS